MFCAYKTKLFSFGFIYRRYCLEVILKSSLHSVIKLSHGFYNIILTLYMQTLLYFRGKIPAFSQMHCITMIKHTLMELIFHIIVEIQHQIHFSEVFSYY